MLRSGLPLILSLSQLSTSLESGAGVRSGCSHPGLSCSSTLPPHPDPCCVNTPGGHLLLTQFWDASPPLGSAENWTIHGLWPDYCAGGFEQFCDREREHSNIAAIIKSSSPDLASYMEQHWLSLNGNNNHLWAHEWNKHGTCISTLEPECYDSGAASAEAVTSYFTHAASLYATLNTFAVLAAAGITPSHDNTYTLEEIQAVISSAHAGFPVTLRCHGSSLQEIWYHYSVRGPLRHAVPFDSSSEIDLRSNTDIFVPTSPDVSKSNCPKSGIRYLPKDAPHPTRTRGPPHTATQTNHPTSAPERPFSGRGHLIVRPISSPPISGAVESLQQAAQQPFMFDAEATSHSLSETNGCLIRGGLWYTSGSCATYLAKTDAPHVDNEPPITGLEDYSHMFTLSSLYFPCAVVDETRFTCAKDLGVQTIFEGINVTSSTGDEGKTVTREVLAWRGRTKFYAESIPGRFEKVEIFADDDGGKREVELEIEWQGI